MIVFSCFFFSILSIKKYEVHIRYTIIVFKYFLRQKKKLLLTLFSKPVYRLIVANHLTFMYVIDFDTDF